MVGGSTPAICQAEAFENAVDDCVEVAQRIVEVVVGPRIFSTSFLKTTYENRSPNDIIGLKQFLRRKDVIVTVLKFLYLLIRSLFTSRTSLIVENSALRQQVSVLQLSPGS